MTIQQLDKNKISFLKTAVPMYGEYEVPDDAFEGMSEERKRQLEKNINEFLKKYEKQKH